MTTQTIRQRLTYTLLQVFDKRGELTDKYVFKLERFDITKSEYLEEGIFMITSKLCPEVDDYEIFYKLLVGNMRLEQWDELLFMQQLKAATIKGCLGEFINENLNYWEYGTHIVYDDLTDLEKTLRLNTSDADAALKAEAIENAHADS